MKLARLHLASFLAGCGLALLALVAMGQSAPPPSWEYKIVDDPSESDLRQLSGEWEFAGYLGQGTRGSDNDQTLWKRPSK